MLEDPVPTVITSSWKGRLTPSLASPICFLKVLQKAMIHGGRKKGLHECAKALDRRTARLCCLAKDCENDEYKKLIKGLCAEGEVHVVMVEHGKDLGAWCGLAKLDGDGSVADCFDYGRFGHLCPQSGRTAEDCDAVGDGLELGNTGFLHQVDQLL